MLNVAILGAGTMGRVHGDSYAKVGNSRVVAVCDVDEEKAGMAAAGHSAKIYADFNEMLAKEEIDVVDICLPTYLHKEFALKAMQQKKHVFCEKPIALGMEDAKEMVRAAEVHRVKFTVGHVVRYFPAYSRAARIIADGKIGEAKLIRTARTGAYPSRYWKDWYRDHRLSGGTLLDLVIHDFDWIRHNFGEVERVYAKNLKEDDREKRDHCLAVLRLKSGAIAHVEGSWAYPEGSVFGTSFEVIGTRGQIEFDSRDSAPVKKHIGGGDTVKIVSESPLTDDEEPYTAQLQDFVNCILEDREPCVTAEEAVKALAVSLAALKSAKTGEAVIPGGGRG